MALCRYSRLLSRFQNQLSPKNPLPALFTTASAAPPDNESPIRPQPPPIQVALTESAGRGVYATRRINAGDLIHTAKPLVAHPSLSSIKNVCYFCLRKMTNLRESEAQSIVFCSDECKEKSKVFYDVETQADWSAFHDYCRTQGLKYPLLVKRLACMVLSGAESAGICNILQPASLTPEMISKMDEEYHLLRNAFVKANFKDKSIQFLTKKWYIAVLSRIRINAFRIELAGGLYEDLLTSAAASVEAEAAVGNAIYMLPSFYNHDCDPNTHILWIVNADARLKALRDIEKGEELRICYIDASMSYDARQRILSQGFGFKCNCSRCLCGD